jgi:hypothetical protein
MFTSADVSFCVVVVMETVVKVGVAVSAPLAALVLGDDVVQEFVVV